MVKKLAVVFIALSFMAVAMTGCSGNKGNKGTLNKVRAETNKAFKEVDKASRKAIKKVKGSR